MNLFNQGMFLLHSGETSNFLIDCEALTDADLKAIARELAHRLPLFGVVEGVPRGGLRLAKALEEYATGLPQDGLLIADDVLSTGASMKAQRAGREAKGAVIFSRTQKIPTWITPLFVMLPIEGAPEWQPSEKSSND